MSDKIDPKKIFYCALAIGNLDGTFEWDCDGNGTFLSEKAANEFATDSVDEHGGEFVIIRCVPIRRIHRPPLPSVTVEEIEEPTGQRKRRERKPQSPPQQEASTGAATTNGNREVIQGEVGKEVLDDTLPGFLDRHQAAAAE